MRLKEWGAFFYASLIWGSSFLLIKLALEDLQPFTLVSVRLFFATLGLWVIAGMQRVRVPTDRGTLGKLVFLGFVNTAFPFTMITWGTQYIDSGVASVLNATTPLVALVLAHFFLADERITWVKLIGLLVGFGGVLLIFSRSLGGFLEVSGGNAIAGHIAVMLGSCGYAVAAVFAKRSLGDIPLVMLGAVPITTAFILTSAGALAFEGPLSLAMSTRTFLALLTLGLLAVSVAQIFYFWLIGQWGPTRTTLVTYVIPVVGLTLGVLVLNEPLDWRLLGGFVLVLAGIIVVNRRQRSALPAAPGEAAA